MTTRRETQSWSATLAETLRARNRRVAVEILELLGGGNFILQAGARDLAPVGNGLGMRLAGHGLVNLVRIRRNVRERHDLEFCRLAPKGRTAGRLLLVVQDIAAVELGREFTRHTGRRTPKRVPFQVPAVGADMSRLSPGHRPGLSRSELARRA